VSLQAVVVARCQGVGGATGDRRQRRTARAQVPLEDPQPGASQREAADEQQRQRGGVREAARAVLNAVTASSEISKPCASTSTSKNVQVVAGAPATTADGDARPVATITRDRYEELPGRVRLLSWLSLVWMTAEGAVAIVAGLVAGSIALVGFGLDSAIEGFASVIIIWRFTGHRVFSHGAEQRAQKLVAVQFFLLAPYVGVESIRALIGGEHPDVSWVGVGLSISSVILMPLLAIAKQRLADQLGSAATAGEGRQNMLCAYLAGRCWLACSATRSSAHGGWTPRSVC